MLDLPTAIDGLAAVDVGGLPAPALGEHIRSMMRERNRLDGQIQRALAVFDQRGYCEADGAPSTTSWLRGRCLISGGEASGRVRAARGLCDLPATAAALEAGVLTLGHARAIAMLATDTDVQATQDVEEQLVALAAVVDPVRFSIELRRLREAYQRDGADGKDTEKPDETDGAFRRLSVTASFKGRFNLAGWLTPEGGALLKAALDALARPVANDDRSAAQRYADALVELARRQLNNGDLPAKNGVRPHLFVMSQGHAGTATGGVPPDAEAQRASDGGGPKGPRSGPGEGGHPDGPRTAPGGTALRLVDGQVIGGGHLSDKALERIACDATITRVLFGTDGHVLDLGRGNRVVSSAQWRALLLRDGGCVIPGHDCPAAYTEAHHLLSWLQFGLTDLSNLALVCAFGHKLLHERGFRLYLSVANCWVLQKPDGTEIVGMPLGQTRRSDVGSLEVALLNGPRGPCDG